MESGLSTWAVLLAAMVTALLGLVLAAKAVDTGMAVAGWLFLVFGVAFSFRLAGKMAVQPETPAPAKAEE